MAVAGLLAQYMAVKNQLSYCQLEDTRWNDLATAMSKKLSEQESASGKWDDASASFYDEWGSTKEFKAGGQVFQNKEGGHPSPINGLKKEQACASYASKKVPKFDSDKLEEYSNLDIEYDTMVSMYDTLCTELQAQADALKEQLGTEAQDTHLIQ